MHYPSTDNKRYHTVATESTGQSNLVIDETAGINHEGGAESKNQNAVISVLIVDDHALLREGLQQLLSLEEDIQVVGDAVDGFEAMEKIRLLQPDVVLMDVHLPVIDGIAITRQVTQIFPDMAVIILTMYRQQQQVVEAMKSGAKGYLLKSTSARDVARAIRNAHAGEIAIAPSLTGALVNELRRQPEGTDDGQHVAQLSEKEIEIIRYLAAGMSNKEIAERLAYSEKTVKNYLSIIFQKLHLRDRTQVAIFALRHGLLPDGWL